MAYVTEANVESELSVAIETTTQPTIAGLAEFIAQIEFELNGILHSVRISVPISESASPTAFGIAKQTALWGICSRALAAYAGIVLDQTPKMEMYWERYKAKLEEIKENPDILYDATTLSSDSDLMVDGIVDGDDEYNDPVFTMDDIF